jgi:protein-tyrosine phosphatase
MPPMIEGFFVQLCAAGYVPVLTHPERLTWIARRYDVICRLFDRGVWMQVTSGALLGDFGAAPRYWAERMIGEGRCHILATDAHNSRRRAPRLRAGYEAAARLVGEEEAANLVYWRPLAILDDREATDSPPPPRLEGGRDDDRRGPSWRGRSREFAVSRR